MTNKEKIERAIALLDEADGLLQEALSDKDSYEFHEVIANVIDDINDLPEIG